MSLLWLLCASSTDLAALSSTISPTLHPKSQHYTQPLPLVKTPATQLCMVTTPTLSFWSRGRLCRLLSTIWTQVVIHFIFTVMLFKPFIDQKTRQVLSGTQTSLKLTTRQSPCAETLSCYTLMETSFFDSKPPTQVGYET